MDLHQLDQRHVWHPFTQIDRWATTPSLIIERGEGNYLIDIDGNRYLDAVSSLWLNVHGHRHPSIDAAVREQLEKIAHSTLLGLANEPSIKLAAKLATIAPQGLTRVFFSDSGSTAVEVALKIAFQYWHHLGESQRTNFVTLDQAYHGDTLGAVSVGGLDTFHQMFHPLLFHCVRIPTPHLYRAAPPLDTAQALRDHCLNALDEVLTDRADRVCAVIVEPRVQGAAGILTHPPGFLKGIEARCRKHNVLLICDEVATGFGRTGHLFSCNAEAVRPDLMPVAKGLSGGYLPVAATLATEEIFAAFRGSTTRTFFHGHSYTGNPLACAAALASLDLLPEVMPTLDDKIATLSQLLSTTFAKHPHVGDIRQCGLMVGIELVADRQTQAPFPPDALTGHHVCMEMRSSGVIARPLGDVIVLMPPLSITTRELECIVAALHTSLEKISVE